MPVLHRHGLLPWTPNQTGKLETDGSNTKYLGDAKPHSMKYELRMFFGLCNVYRRFIETFAVLLYPLNQLLRNNAPTSSSQARSTLQHSKKFIDRIWSPLVLALLVHMSHTQLIQTPHANGVVGDTVPPTG